MRMIRENITVSGSFEYEQQLQVVIFARTNKTISHRPLSRTGRETLQAKRWRFHLKTVCEDQSDTVTATNTHA
jgi:hypothetical protein